MHYANRLIPYLALVLFAVSCATISQAGDEEDGSRNLLTNEDLAETAEMSLYNAIYRLRPFWLRSRATSALQGPDPVIVYVDNVRVGEAPYLRDMQVETVEEVRYVNAADATTRWGIGVAGGVILVTTKSG